MLLISSHVWGNQNKYFKLNLLKFYKDELTQRTASTQTEYTREAGIIGRR